MWKKLLSSVLAVVLLLGCCTVALAGSAGSGLQVEILETAIDGITIGVNTDGEAALKNGRVVLSYPDALTLASAEAKLPAEAGITDLDTSKPGTLSFAWASYEPQGAVRLLEVTFQGKCDAVYPITLFLPETGEKLEVNLEIPYRFVDVQDASKWYFTPIYQVYERGLMQGVGGDMFAPHKTLNRAALVTVLYRMAGSPDVREKSPFTDVPADLWYTRAVAWAVQAGVMKGYGQGIFAPGKAVTRQEMATMIHRYWLLQNEAGPVNSEGLSGYRDGDQVAGWAEEAMIWAVENQIMQGVAAGTLSPGNTATRAQVAQVLVNYQNMG